MGFKAEELTILYPPFRDKLIQLEGLLESRGVNILFSVGYRSPQEQNILYAQGRTKPGAIVTNANGDYTQHAWGIAADFYRNEKGKAAFDNSDGFFDEVGKYAKQLGLGWGGDWKGFTDKPHIYMPTWGSTTTIIREKYGTPEKFMATWSDVSIQCPSSTAIEYEQYSKKDFIKDVQKAIGAKVDGIAGRETISKTPTISVNMNNRHKVVKVVQHWLNMNGHYCGSEDGIFGKNTKSGVMHYQAYIGFRNPDGIMDSGSRTWKAILL